MNVRVLYLVTIFVFTTVFAHRPLTSLYAEQLGATLNQISLITLAYSIGPLIIAISIGKYIDRYGEKLPLILGGIGLFIATIIPFSFSSVPVLILAQFFLGGSQIFAIVALQNGVSRSLAAENRDKGIGLFSLCSSGGMLLGPLIGSFIAEYWSYATAFLIVAAIPICSVICVAFLRLPVKEEKKKSVAEDLSVVAILAQRNIRKTIIASMIILASLDIFYVYFPLYASSIGLSVSQIGLLLSLMALGNIIARVFLEGLLKWFGRIRAFYLFIALGGIAYGCIGFTEDVYLLLIVVIVLGSCLGVTQPISIILAYNLAPPRQTAEVLSIRLASNRLAQTALPFAFANASALWGLGALFTANAFVILLAAFQAKQIQESPQLKEQEEMN